MHAKLFGQHPKMHFNNSMLCIIIHHFGPNSSFIFAVCVCVSKREEERDIKKRVSEGEKSEREQIIMTIEDANICITTAELQYSSSQKNSDIFVLFRSVQTASHHSF